MREEETGPEEEEDPVTKLNRLAAEKKSNKQAAENADILGQLSIRERLIARQKTKHIETVLKDDQGDFVIETRIMSSDERYRGLLTFARMSKLDEKGEKDALEYNEAMIDLQKIVQEIVVTPGLEGYFVDGEASDDVILLIFLNTLYATMESVGEGIQSFREITDRAIAPGDDPGDGTATPG